MICVRHVVVQDVLLCILAFSFPLHVFLRCVLYANVYSPGVDIFTTSRFRFVVFSWSRSGRFGLRLYLYLFTSALVVST